MTKLDHLSRAALEFHARACEAMAEAARTREVKALVALQGVMSILDGKPLTKEQMREIVQKARDTLGMPPA